jgi:putative hydrolase of the HAD superfamily
MRTDAETALIAYIRAHTAPLAPQPTATTPRTDPVAEVRAVLFDVYGTLVISGCGDIGISAANSAQCAFTEAWSAVGLDLAALPRDFDGPAALRAHIQADHAQRRAMGVDHPEVDIVALWQALLGGLGVAVDEALARRVALEYELRTNPVWPMPGLADVIRTLAGRGLVLGIVSNAQFYTPLMLQAFLGRPLEEAGFDPRCCAFSYRQGVAKPSIAVYEPALAALRRHHGIAPTAVLYLGNDMRNDVHPAQQLGCRTALFAGDARSLRLREDDPDLRRVTPDRVVTDLQQLTSDLLPPG